MPITRQETQDGFAAQVECLPRLGVLAKHPIQYQAPLYQELARRGMVDLAVAFLSSDGARRYHDPAFGVTLAWDIDLLGGYRSTTLARKPLRAKADWLFAEPLAARSRHRRPERSFRSRCPIGSCRVSAPRAPHTCCCGDSYAESPASGLRRIARHLVAGAAVRAAADALPIGQRNAAFYQRYGRIPHYLASYSVDNHRFHARRIHYFRAAKS